MAYHEWKRLPDNKNMWSKFKDHYNEAFNELYELIEITARGAGFGANAMELTPLAIDEISGALDSIANATVQKKDMVDKLAVALCMAMDKISRLNKLMH